MICPNCGTDCEDGVKECILCGYLLDETGVFSKQSTSAGDSAGAVKGHGDGGSICPKCGNTVQEGKAFCPMCGTKLDKANAGSVTSETAHSSAHGTESESLNTDIKPKGKSKKKYGIIGGLCAAGAAAGIIIPLVIVNAGKPQLSLEQQLESLQAKAETTSSWEEGEKIYKEALEIQNKIEESIEASSRAKAQSELASIQAAAESSSSSQSEIQSTEQTHTQTQAQTEATEATFAGTSTQTTAATTTAFDTSKTETKAAAASSTYEAVVKDISWSDAISECQAKGGHLATVTSESEMNELISLAESKGLRYVWLGGYTVVLDNDVYSYWLNDEPFSYTKWYPGEPSGTDEDGELEGALMMWRINGEWTWNDQRDDVVNSGLDYFKGYTGYICEYD